MTAHRIASDLTLADFRITDPGSGGKIRIDRQLGFVPLKTAGAESRTLAAPTKAGLIAILEGDAITTSCTITVTGGVNDTANTVLVLSVTGQYVILISIKTGTTFAWNILYPNCGTASVFGGAGTVTYPMTDATVDKHFFEFHCKATGATGTSRLRREWLYLSGGAGGECYRAATTVMAAAPVDTCNGIHTTLDFGTSAGNITGLGTAIRAGVLVGKRAITGTVAAVMAELYGETSGTVAGAMSLFRAVVGGDSTAAHSINDNGFLFDIESAEADGHIVEVGSSSGTLARSLKCRINGVTQYLYAYATPA
jgi:hypothetical protein